MGSINLYKIDKSKTTSFIRKLSEKMKIVKTITIERNVDDNKYEFGFTLYLSSPNETKNLKWNWLLSIFDRDTISFTSSPNAVLLIGKEEVVEETPEDETKKDTTSDIYAVTFGHSYFVVDKYCDTDFGFDFAKRVQFDDIKTTTLTTPNSKRNKTVNTYINYNELEFDSGESFAKLKAKAVLPEGFGLYKPALEIGNSIRFVTDEDSLERIADIILHTDNIILTEEVKHNIPVFTKVKDEEKIEVLDEHLKAYVKEKPEICISELDIVGSTEIFNRNDNEFILKYKRKHKNVTSLSTDELKDFCSENSFDFPESVLDISVSSPVDGDVVCTSQVKNMIDYTDDEERCLLSKGIWYQYNDDYLNYLKDSISEIQAEYHKEFDFSNQVYSDFIDKLFIEVKEKDKYKGKSEGSIKSSLKSEYYTEKAFNTYMEREYGFNNYDREGKGVGGATVELMDLYKDKTMFAVKIGNKSSKLCYAVDQSLTSLQLYKHKLLKNMPSINTVALWLILERKTHIEKDGVPDINELDMLMLKNRIDGWKKEVRLQGMTPLIYINYRK